MASLNKVQLIGHLGADPETRHLASGDPVTNLRVATTETWKDKASGEKKESTEWHRVVLFKRLAEIAGQYLRKGSQVYLEGRIKTRKWQDKDGQDRYTTEIEASELKMLGGRQDDQQDRQPSGQSDHQQAKSNGYAPQPETKPRFDDMDDDIPFN